MRLEKALDIAHTLRRHYGEAPHCHEPECSVCACLALAYNVKTQQGEISSLRKLLDGQVAVTSPICRCGRKKIDGLCGVCDT